MSTAILIAVCLGSPALFAVTVWLSRAGAKRSTAALAGGVVAAAFDIGWDALARLEGWWTYSAANDLLDTLALALTAAFVFGAAAGLIGWRMMRAMGWTGVATFFAGFVGLGVLRDQLLAVNTDLMAFGQGAMPQLMGALGYLAFALAVQMTMLVIAGLPTRDPLWTNETER
ncbi:MAG: hypothetical protein R3C46_10035 [Hyphomonadaceae bacterium]